MQVESSNLIIQIRDRHSKAKIYAEHLIPGRMLSVGRGPSNDIVLQSPFVSRFHMVINWRGDTPTLIDLSSKNGTTLNGHAVGREAPMRAGDIIRASDVTITVEHARSSARYGERGEHVDAEHEAPTLTRIPLDTAGVPFLRSAARFAVATGLVITLCLFLWP